MIKAKPFKESESLFYLNVAEAAQAALAASFAAKRTGLKIIFCSTDGECEKLHSRIRAFLKLEACGNGVRILPKLLPQEDPDAFENFCERSGSINAMHSGDSLVLITTPQAIISEVPAASERMELKRGMNFSIDALKNKLVEFGYYNEVLCEGPGQFAIRGGIVDVYPVAAQSPYRIDFFGDEIDTIRPFDPDTQLSDGQPERTLNIDAFSTSENTRPAFDFLPEAQTTWIFMEPARLSLEYPDEFGIFEKSNNVRDNFQKIFLTRKRDAFIGISSLAECGEIFADAPQVRFASEDLSQYRPMPFSDGVGYERQRTETELRTNFVRRIARWQKEGFAIFIEAEGNGETRRIEEIFAEAGEKISANFISAFFGEGFFVEFTDDNSAFDWDGISQKSRGIVCISSLEIFGRRIKTNIAPRRKMLSRRAEVDSLLDFSELTEGDYVVHLAHGICRYHGVNMLNTEDGMKQEVIELEFEDKAKLFLPLHRAHLLSRYIGLDKRSPKLSKLDSRSWVKVRAAAETAALDYAAELLDMQSRREFAEGYAFPQDSDWQHSFEDSFPFVETPDQLRAIDEVKADMQSSTPMDRLICADVGFGKTEIALRAAFKCLMAGRQVAILCPTTILCQQHFKTFKERMAPYPAVVEMMSRFRKPREIKRIKTQLAAGQIDLIIGTHALLAHDVTFKDLGLLVIDEEHRFGVKHKEKIKGLKEGVDVMTMSATPIPRTLYFAMMGAKTISLMETPPKNRFPVETIVREYSDDVVKTAIDRETARGGQVFYLHNRVKTIEARAAKLREMFPNLRIEVGHGQMDEKELENLMGDFMDGKFDIFVCTTIIESGLDIPNCNTIIIEGADKFGLSQLYQLRGRVGRFTRKAYAYLFLHRHAQLVEKAHKRLSAIRQYNKPGAGFRIATRDLQLRGCGNLLGAKQSGHIAGVGFDMYCSLLKQSIARLKGEKSAQGIRASVALDFVTLGEGGKRTDSVESASNVFQEMKILEIQQSLGQTLAAHIPEDYIPQTKLRIDVYRRLELCASYEETEKIESELNDRYGKIPHGVHVLIALARIRIGAELNGIARVETEGAKLKLKKAHSALTEFVKINGHFPLLSQTDSNAKLKEIQSYLKTALGNLKFTS